MIRKLTCLLPTPRLREVGWPRLSEVIILLVLTLFTNVLALAVPLFSLQVFDRVLTTASTATLVSLVLIVALIIVCQSISDAARSSMLARIVSNVERGSLCCTLNRMAQNTSESLKVDVTLLEISRSGSMIAVAAAVLDAPWSLIFIGALFMLHPALGWFALVSVALIAVAALISHCLTRAIKTEISRGYASGLSMLLGSSRSPADLRIMGFADVLRTQAKKHLDAATKHNLTAAERQAWIESATRAVRTFLQVAIVTVVALLVLAQEAGTGTIMAASMLFARALYPAEKLVAMFPSLCRAFDELVKIAECVTATPPLTSRTKMPQIRGKVEITGGALTGANGRKLLEGIDLTIEAGQIVAVVGEGGAGKTVFLKAITGALPLWDGNVRVDGTAICDYDTEQFSHAVGYVSEQCELGVGTVSFLISRTNSPDDEALIAACKLAGAHKVIQRLPRGYQTLLGTEEQPLSLSEKKRIALARAFYSNPKLVVLDDPTAGLDDQGERDVLHAIEEMGRRGSTVVVASRHPRLAYVADRLLMLSGGRICLNYDRDDLSQFFSPRLAASAS